MSEEGVTKSVTESYLVEAMTFAEAEERITSEMSSFIDGDFSVEAVKKCSVSEVFRCDDKPFYSAKVGFLTIDEKSGVEKTTSATMLIQAEDFDHALSNLKEGMKGTMSDWKTISLSESNIIEVYDYPRTAQD